MFDWLKSTFLATQASVGREAAPVREGVPAPAVVLIHGLAGNANETWRTFLKLATADPELSGYSFDAYGFPTGLFGRLPRKRYPPLRDLATGLATELRLRHAQRERTVLIGHSLGGLICRQYMLDQVRAGREPLVSRALLLATPNNGAVLAAVSSELFPSQSHISELSPFSEALDRLNDDWVNMRMDERVDITYVAGGADAIVSQPSAKGMPGRKLDEMLIGYGHLSIVRPEGLMSSNYLLMKKFITENCAVAETPTQFAAPTAAGGDPLFEIYSIENEPYYIVRRLDAFLSAATALGHAWLSGPSGVGKTAALKRRCELANWTVYHLFLSSYEKSDSRSLLRGICVQLAEAMALEGLGPIGNDLVDITRCFREIVRSISPTESVAILVEEIPLPPGPEFAAFVGSIESLVLALESENARNIRLLFSSINDPANDLTHVSAKLRSRLQFLRFDRWVSEESLALVDRIADAESVALSPAERGEIVTAADGSPRFAKAVFRRWRNGTAGELSLSGLLESVKAEQV